LSAHHIYESVREHYLRVYDAAGWQLHSISLVTDSYTYKPESAFRFSPVNSKHVAWVYDDDDFGTGAVVIDLSTKRFVGLDYDGIAWTREGDLLLIDAGRVYRSRPSDGLFGNGELLFDFVEPIEHPDVSPANNDIAFHASGQIFAIGLNVNNARRMVAYPDEHVDYPSWSPDGRFLSVTKNETGFIIAADTMNAFQTCNVTSVFNNSILKTTTGTKKLSIGLTCMTNSIVKNVIITIRCSGYHPYCIGLGYAFFSVGVICCNPLCCYVVRKKVECSIKFPMSNVLKVLVA